MKRGFRMEAKKKIGILTSGGDSPGMNACLRAVVRTAIENNFEAYVIEEGYYGILHNLMHKVEKKDVSDIIQKGGTIIGTARLPEFKEPEVQKKAAEILKKQNFIGVVCIGGDGTYAGAMKLTENGINCIGLPGTIDNDITSSDYTIGFDTALNTIVENIDRIKDTSTSHKRCAVVEVMGRYCPDLACFAGLATGAELILTSLNPMSEKQILEHMKKEHDQGKRSALVVVAEHLLDVNDLAKKIEAYSGYETRATVLGHLQRGGSPSAMDRVLASRLGYHAVMLLKENKGGICLGIVDNKIQQTPILKALDKTSSSHDKKISISKEIIKIAEIIE